MNKYIEFLGLPGAGKTEARRRIFEYYTDNNNFGILYYRYKNILMPKISNMKEGLNKKIISLAEEYMEKHPELDKDLSKLILDNNSKNSIMFQRQSNERIRLIFDSLCALLRVKEKYFEKYFVSRKNLLLEEGFLQVALTDLFLKNNRAFANARPFSRAKLGDVFSIIPLPDVVIMFEVDPYVATERMQKREKETGQKAICTVNENSEEDLLQTVNAFKEFLKKRNSVKMHTKQIEFHIVNGNLSPEQVANDVKKILDKY